MSERLNKVLADLGYGSRRAIDRQIAAGIIKVNDVVAPLGQKIEASDIIKINNHYVTREKTRQILFAFNKPKGVVTTRKDQHADSNVMEFLPPSLQHLYPVGRLDKMSRGLLLLTNNGTFSLQSTHPRYNHIKEYIVTLRPKETKSKSKIAADFKRVNDEIINEDAQSKPMHVLSYILHPSSQLIELKLELNEGKKRQIRRVFDNLGYTVIDLLRTKIGDIYLDNLEEGGYRDITPSDWQ
jgi:pseudouridine synthase